MKLTAAEQAELKKLHIAEEAIRADIENERRWLDYRMREHAEAEQALLAREAGIAEAARAMVASDLEDKQHTANARLADRIARFRLGDAYYEEPSNDEVNAALVHFGATLDVFRLANPYIEAPASWIALVQMHKKDVIDALAMTEREEREEAINRFINAQRDGFMRTDSMTDAEYAARVAQQQRLEA